MTAHRVLIWRAVGVGALAGMASGLVVAPLARIAMRIVALAAHVPVMFTVAGTLFIVLFITLIGAPLGVVFVAVKPYLPGPRFTKGLLFGLLLFLVAGVPFLLGAFGLAFVGEELLIGPPLLGRSLFGVLFLIYGIVVGMAEGWSERSLPTPVGKESPRRGLYVLLALLGGAGLLLILFQLLLALFPHLLPSSG